MISPRSHEERVVDARGKHSPGSHARKTLLNNKTVFIYENLHKINILYKVWWLLFWGFTELKQNFTKLANVPNCRAT